MKGMARFPKCRSHAPAFRGRHLAKSPEVDLTRFFRCIAQRHANPEYLSLPHAKSPKNNSAASSPRGIFVIPSLPLRKKRSFFAPMPAPHRARQPRNPAPEFSPLRGNNCRIFPVSAPIYLQAGNIPHFGPIFTLPPTANLHAPTRPSYHEYPRPQPPLRPLNKTRPTS